ncbi:MAG: hypothetical protein OFPII_35940 [Osedax symbiont Rs1]|nr:MAG: hypothetical protein OFPII_35940 [Osedax symbiont Rs1]
MGYRQDILRAVEGDPSHPIHNGIQMQAHHLISRKALIGSSIDKQIEDFKYDINNVANIALIPCTLQGACHLNTQLHRGNHSSAHQDLLEDNGNNDVDGEHPPSYHDEIRDRIEQIKEDIDDGDYCDGNRYKKLLERMDELSKDIAEDINSHDLALTNISRNFGSGRTSNGKGCCDADYIVDARKYRFNEACSNEQNHYKNRRAKKQQKENIDLKKTSNYEIQGGQ